MGGEGCWICLLLGLWGLWFCGYGMASEWIYIGVREEVVSSLGGLGAGDCGGWWEMRDGICTDFHGCDYLLIHIHIYIRTCIYSSSSIFLRFPMLYNKPPNLLFVSSSKNPSLSCETNPSCSTLVNWPFSYLKNCKEAAIGELASLTVVIEPCSCTLSMEMMRENWDEGVGLLRVQDSALPGSLMVWACVSWLEGVRV